MTRTLDARDLGKPMNLPTLPFQGPPALRHPLAVLVSARAVTAALDLLKPEKLDWSPCR